MSIFLIRLEATSKIATDRYLPKMFDICTHIDAKLCKVYKMIGD